MEYKILFSPRARKDFKKIDRETKTKVKEALNGILAIPPRGDIKKLKGFKERYRLRVGDWRILYSLDRKIGELIVLEILPRKDAYK
ncbi:MAG: type II toxin-antitoxin system RelE/ParE family toxin [Bacillota bacterium]